LAIRKKNLEKNGKNRKPRLTAKNEKKMKAKQIGTNPIFL